MKNNQLIALLKFAAIAGNILFMLWITYNGINEGFKGTLPEKISYIGLMVLLGLNSVLIFHNKQE